MTKSSCVQGLSPRTAANEYDVLMNLMAHPGTPPMVEVASMFLHRTLEMEGPFREARGDDFWTNLAEREEIICSTGGSASFCYPTVSEINSGGLTRRT